MVNTLGFSDGLGHLAPCRQITATFGRLQCFVSYYIPMDFDFFCYNMIALKTKELGSHPFSFDI